MKKATILVLTSLFLAAFLMDVVPHAATAATSSMVTVEDVERVVVPIYGGLLLINDTLTISATNKSTTIADFQIGFPLTYKANLVLSMAFDAEDPSEELSVVANTGLDALGYYGVTIVFNADVRDLLYQGESYTFTAVSLFSDLIETSQKTVNGTLNYMFTADFPAFPSLTQSAPQCNATVVLPEGMNYYAEDFPFNATKIDQTYYLNYAGTLPRLSQTTAKVSFISESRDTFACFSVLKLSREITVDSGGRVAVSEIHLIQSRTTFQLDKIRLNLPKNSLDVSAHDEQAQEIAAVLVKNETQTYEFSLPVLEGQSRSLRLDYYLQRESHLVQLDPQTYELHLNLLETIRTAPRTSITEIILPEGASILSFPDQTSSIQRSVFQEKLSFSSSNATWLQKEWLSFTYAYSRLWAAFRPTVWATSLVVIGSIVALAWQRPRAPAVVSVVLVPRRILSEFVETYEEKKRVLVELEQIKQKAKKGKVSRRRYKIRKTTLENKQSTLSKRLAELRQRIISGGASYADIMRTLEVAEIELDNLEADMRRIEVRFKRGEISAQTYRRLLEGDLRRQEKAKTTIDGVLLRLRE